MLRLLGEFVVNTLEGFAVGMATYLGLWLMLICTCVVAYYLLAAMF